MFGDRSRGGRVCRSRRAVASVGRMRTKTNVNPPGNCRVTDVALSVGQPQPRAPSESVLVPHLGTSWANRAKKLNCFVKITSNEGRGRKEGIDNLAAALFLNRARWNLDSCSFVHFGRQGECIMVIKILTHQETLSLALAFIMMCLLGFTLLLAATIRIKN